MLTLALLHIHSGVVLVPELQMADSCTGAVISTTGICIQMTTAHQLKYTISV